MNSACAKYRAYLEGLTPDRLLELPEYVTPDVHFKDPFNEVHGVEPMIGVFRHMFENVEDIRFTIHNAASDGEDVCLLSWTFSGRLRGGPWEFPGTSVLRIAPNGKISEHIDHWDPGAALYERVPVLSWMIRQVKKRASAL